jgi:voltage-gated potassium channel Kch
MEGSSRVDGSANQRVLLIGRGELADTSHRTLDAARARVKRLEDPSDSDIRKALGEEFDSVLVVTMDDHLSLRLALVVRSVRPDVPLAVTVFGRVVASQLERRVEGVRVMSMGDIVAPSFAGPCLDERLLSVRRTDDGFEGIEASDDGLRVVPIDTTPPGRVQRFFATLGSILRPFEHSARILTVGLLGFLAILLIDAVGMALVLDQGPLDALYKATRVIATVGPNPAIDAGPGWFKVFSTVSMLAALAFTAMATAGIVERLLGARLTTIVGGRMVPRKEHVVVVGLGQVGTRLCLLLRDLGVPVVAIERDPDNYNVQRAKDYGLPVVIGSGGSRFLLDDLALDRARALAAVADEELENISVAVAALGMQEDLRTLLRAGGGELANETGSLFRIGFVRDANRIAGTLLAAAALGMEADEAFLYDQTVYLITPDGELQPFEPERENGAGEAAPGEERPARARSS